MSKTYTILKDFKGSPDGIRVVSYTKGDEGVELTESLAKTALEEKWVKVTKASQTNKGNAEAEALAKAKKIDALKVEITGLQTELKALPEKEEQPGMFDSLLTKFNIKPSGTARESMQSAIDAKQAALDELQK